MAARLLRLYLALSQAPSTVTINQLVRVNGVSRRTAFRDLRRLRTIGVPVVFDRANGRFRIDGALHEFGSISPRSWPLCWDEAVGLFAILETTRCPAGSEWEMTRELLAGKLRHWLETRCGRDGSQAIAHARLLANNPRTAISELRRWLDTVGARTANVE
jgi:hypothetical protein